MSNFVSEYIPRLIITLITVAIGFGLLILSYNLFGVIGLIVCFALIMGAGIWFYNYTNKKEECPRQNK